MWVRGRLIFCVALLPTLALIPACGSSTGPNRPKIGVVTNVTAEFWSIAEAGARKASKDFDVEVLFRQPTKGTVSEQSQILEDFLQLGVAGIAVSVLNPEEQTADLRRIAGRVPLLTMDNDAENCGRICYVGTDNYEAGKAVGRLVKKALPDGGTVALFVGKIGPINARLRVQGVIDELAGKKDATGPQLGKYTYFNSAPYTDDAKPTVAQENAKDVADKLRDTPNVCMIGLWAYNAPAILEALKAKQLVGKVKVVAFDEDKATLAGIAEGSVEGTVVQDPFRFGYQSVEILAAEARGDSSKRIEKAIPYRVVTREGGPTEVVAGVDILNLPVDVFRKTLEDNLASVK
jgi:ribose transport system substrate-binding protein